MAEDAIKVPRLTTRIRQLESQPPSSPTSAIRHKLTTTTISQTPPAPNTPQANPFLTPSGGRGNLFNTPSRRRAVATPATPATQAVIRVAIASLPQHPPTDAGRAAHAAQQVAWAEKHGPTAWIDETTPYPLRPGTAPVASGECFRCGMGGHRGAECTVAPDNHLQRNEQRWRVFCANALRDRQAAVGVQLVTVSDYGHTTEVIYGEEPGNDLGPLDEGL